MSDVEDAESRGTRESGSHEEPRECVPEPELGLRVGRHEGEACPFDEKSAHGHRQQEDEHETISGEVDLQPLPTPHEAAVQGHGPAECQGHSRDLARQRKPGLERVENGRP